MTFPCNPIAFLDQIVTRHKKWLANRALMGESLRYMGENVDQQGRGEEFLRHCVFNDGARRPDPADPQTDLALLQLYQHWREVNGLRPIESWDGTRLRPWLPAEANPAVPQVLQGELQHFDAAYFRGRPWTSPLDALGNAVEAYLDDIRRHHVWSRPRSGAGLRLYRFNELNNLELAPYSIRFWGFLAFADNLRRTYLREPVVSYPHDERSDIAFMDEFNRSHFPWHDDVAGSGKCPSWYNQFGLRKRHKYDRGTQGYAAEFLEFHHDLLVAYNAWLADAGMPPTNEWRSDELPFAGGSHDSGYILKYAFSRLEALENPWGRGGTNGQALEPRLWAPDLFDADLSLYDTAAELGHYLESISVSPIGLHGAGHVERCDIRDQYLNNYSLRFFHWHQWIDDLYARIKATGRPIFRPDTKLEDEMDAIMDVGKFRPPPSVERPLSGRWTYRSYTHATDPTKDAQWFVAELELEQGDDGQLTGRLQGYAGGQLHPDYVYTITGEFNQDNVVYQHKPGWWDDRAIVVMRAEGATDSTEGHVYEYRGWLEPKWPKGEEQVPACVGTLMRAERPDDPGLEGTVGSFIATKRQADEPAVR